MQTIWQDLRYAVRMLWKNPGFTTVACPFFAPCCYLFLVALVACWLPARRATKVDPLIALRYE